MLTTPMLRYLRALCRRLGLASATPRPAEPERRHTAAVAEIAKKMDEAVRKVRSGREWDKSEQ
jgi:hypothetical protein